MQTFTAMALLMGLLALASAARLPPDYVNSDVFSGGLRGAQGLQHLIASHGKGKESEGRAYVAFRYTVPTDKKEEFVKRWRGVEKAVADAEGNNIIDLKKTTTDNYRFFGYGEWEDKQGFMDFLKSDATMDWVKYTLENNIIWEIEPLVAPAKEETHTADKHHGKGKHMLFHVLVKYAVAPEDAKSFVEAWEALQKGVDEEEGVRIYSLRKTVGDNYQFYTYGTWESFEDYMEHLKSGHLMKFLEELDDRQIVWNLSPLLKVGEQPE